MDGEGVIGQVEGEQELIGLRDWAGPQLGRLQPSPARGGGVAQKVQDWILPRRGRGVKGTLKMPNSAIQRKWRPQSQVWWQGDQASKVMLQRETEASLGRVRLCLKKKKKRPIKSFVGGRGAGEE